MSSYPPPPPPPFDSRAYAYAAKQQRRAMKEQARLMRTQARIQARAMRRRSIVGPLVLLTLGVVFLLTQTGRVSWWSAVSWYGHWWPVILIGAGLVLLAEWGIDHARMDPADPRGSRYIGGGVVFLMVLLVFFGLASRASDYVGLRDQLFGDHTHIERLLGDRHDADSSVSSSIASGATLFIHNPHGDVNVTGSSQDGEVHVNVHTRTYGWQSSDANDKSAKLQPKFTTQGNDLKLDVAAIEGGEADLTIEVPATNAVTLQADNGDIKISELQAPVSINANHGDVEATGIHGAVNIAVNDHSAGITIHSITGAVTLNGRSGDVEISDITGTVALQGDFFGSTNLEHVNGPLTFTSSRTKFSAARVDDTFTISNSELEASQLFGPVVLKTVDKNITLDRIQGSVDVTNRNGPIEITNAPPLSQITVQNTHGSVDVGVPDGAGFVLNAQTRNGDMENDFGISEATNGDTHTLSGKVGGGQSIVNITTSDGDVTVRRSSLAPLPPLPPLPKITMTPQAPPAAPSPHAPSAPKAPKAPASPTWN